MAFFSIADVINCNQLADISFRQRKFIQYSRHVLFLKILIKIKIRKGQEGHSECSLALIVILLPEPFVHLESTVSSDKFRHHLHESILQTVTPVTRRL